MIPGELVMDDDDGQTTRKPGATNAQEVLCCSIQTKKNKIGQKNQAEIAGPACQCKSEDSKARDRGSIPFAVIAVGLRRNAGSSNRTANGPVALVAPADNPRVVRFFPV
jgi:hypothetical protein